jgi:hypothetical protein
MLLRLLLKAAGTFVVNESKDGPDSCCESLCALECSALKSYIIHRIEIEKKLYLISLPNYCDTM